MSKRAGLNSQFVRERSIFRQATIIVDSNLPKSRQEIFIRDYKLNVMKTILRIVVGVMLTYGLLTLTSCTTNTSDNNNDRETAAVNEDFEEDRTEVAEDLRKLREDISEQIQRIGDKMENASDESRQELAEMNEQLLDERERVDESLEKVETSTKENWSDVREGARNTLQDVKREFAELSDRLSD